MVVPLYFFGSKSTISRFGERFRGDQYSLVSFSFAVLLLTVSLPCPGICKTGRRGTCLPCPMESAPLEGGVAGKEAGVVLPLDLGV